ncbi:hypothetical protein AB4142_29265 [Variovorax sp. 2RAF20]
MRPDGHIAWRHAAATDARLEDVLGALCRVLQVPVPSREPLPSGARPVAPVS